MITTRLEPKDFGRAVDSNNGEGLYPQEPIKVSAEISTETGMQVVIGTPVERELYEMIPSNKDAGEEKISPERSEIMEEKKNPVLLQLKIFFQILKSSLLAPTKTTRISRDTGDVIEQR